MSLPIADGPSPSQLVTLSANAKFGTSGATLCGYKLPAFQYSLSGGFNPPPFAFPPKLPKFNLSIGINCSADNPIDMTAGLEWGGGRVGQADPDPDDLIDQQT